MNPYVKSLKLGFIGAGNMSQAIIRGLVENQVVQPDHIYVSNRTPGKPQKLKEQYGIQVCSSNEEAIEKVDVVILAVKPQDLLGAIEPISRSFIDRQIVVSLAAGLQMKTLSKNLPQARLVRLMPNTPSLIGKGVLGYLLNENDPGLQSTIEDLFSPLGQVIAMTDEDQLEAFTVASSAGTGFIFELMTYWQDWIEEHGFDEKTAQEMTISTFVGTSLLALQSRGSNIEELQARVASKKGVTAAGLESMRELELERVLRISFEKAALRNQEMARSFK